MVLDSFGCESLNKKEKASGNPEAQAGVTGFEPVFTVLETVALPLNYTPLPLSVLYLTDFYILAQG